MLPENTQNFEIVGLSPIQVLSKTSPSPEMWVFYREQLVLLEKNPQAFEKPILLVLDGVQLQITWGTLGIKIVPKGSPLTSTNVQSEALAYWAKRVKFAYIFALVLLFLGGFPLWHWYDNPHDKESLFYGSLIYGTGVWLFLGAFLMKKQKVAGVYIVLIFAILSGVVTLLFTRFPLPQLVAFMYFFPAIGAHKSLPKKT